MEVRVDKNTLKLDTWVHTTKISIGDNDIPKVLDVYLHGLDENAGDGARD